MKKKLIHICAGIALLIGIYGCSGNEQNVDSENTNNEFSLQGMYTYKEDDEYILVDLNTRDDLDYPAFYIYNRTQSINEYGTFDENEDGSITIHSDHYEGYTGILSNDQLILSDHDESIELEKRSDTLYYITE